MESFAAWSLPPDTGSLLAGEIRERPVRHPDGEKPPHVPRLAHPDPEGVDFPGLRSHLLEARQLFLRPHRAVDLADVLGSVGARFLEPGDPLRERALYLLPGHAGVSEPMARAILDGMAADWTAERLRRLLRAEFSDPGVLDGFLPGPESRLHAAGPPLVVQVAAGNAPGVSVGSLIRALLVKSAVLLKPALNDAVLPVLFAEGLREEAPELAGAVAVLHWPGSEAGVWERALEAADLVVAYGGLETVRSIRGSLPPTTPLVAYRHRVSFGAVAREVLTPVKAREAARRIARAVALFDQRGCVSPHLVYVEEGGEVAPEALAEMVAHALEDEAERLPPGVLEPGEASAARQLVGSEELREAAGSGVRLFGGEVGRGTVVYDPDPAFTPSCLARTVRVKPVDDLKALEELLEPAAPYLQSAGVEAPPDRLGAVAEALARVGVVRVTDMASLPWPPAWWNHDGNGPLRALVTWVELEAGSS